MGILERLFCGFVRLLWACAQVDRRGTRPEARPGAANDAAPACRCLAPGRTVLPGW